MPLDLLIRHGQVVTAAGVASLAIGIAEGRIVALAPEIADPATETLDATNLHIFPGLIDSHVHFNEAAPGGRTAWEGIATGSAALAAGGGTVFFDMPLNSLPPTLDAAAFDAKLAACRQSARTDFALWGGLTPDNLDHLEELAERGVIGFKAFMANSGIPDFARADDLTLYRGMKKAQALGLPVAVHAESEEITSRLAAEALAAGCTSIRDYLASRPVVAEVEAVTRAIALAGETGCRLHIVHISHARSAERVARDAAHGWADVTCETCPHYLALSDLDLERLGAPAKCAPPLRAPADVEALWQALAAGHFAFVASDHSPAPPAMKKDPNFFQVWGGIAGIQSTLPILLSRQPAIPLPQVARLTAANVAARYGLPTKGAIAAGYDADLTLVDLNTRYQLTTDSLLDRHKLSPYVGRTFHACIRRTLLRGQTIFLDGKLVGPPIGQFLRPAR